MDIAEWSELYRIVTSEEGGVTGPWHNDRVPYMVEPMRAITDPRSRRVVVMSGTQMGKTMACILNAAGYYIMLDPCAIMLAEPTVELARTLSGKRFVPMIAEIPELREKISVEKARSSGNTILEKSFPGGYIVFAGANSAASLKSRPIRVLLCDEVDEWPRDLEGQGSAIELAIARTDGQPDPVIVIVSTPTIKNHSNIEDEYTESTQERWSHTCPSCGVPSQHRPSYKDADGQRQTLIDFATLKRKCPNCDEEYTRREWDRTDPGGGLYVADNPGHQTRGFHVNSWDSHLTWPYLIDQFRKANALAKRGDTSKLKTFINTKNAETWEAEAEIVSSHSLERRREMYPQPSEDNAYILPDGVCAITMGVDTQDTRLAYQVVGWGAGFESWALEYHEIWGSPAQGSVWNELDAVFRRQWGFKNGRRLKIARTCIDTGGHFGTQVHTFCRARVNRGCVPIQGRGGDKVPITERAKRSKERGLYLIGVDGLKTNLYQYLRDGKPGDGQTHFPVGENGEDTHGIGADYFDMLTAEKRILSREAKTGKPVYIWELPEGKQNEALDTWVYARAALQFITPRIGEYLSRLTAQAAWAKSPNDDEPAIDTPRVQVALAQRKPLPGSRNAVLAGRGIQF